MIRWRVYYDTGGTLDDTQCSVSDVVADGVIVIVQAHDDPNDPARGGRELLYDRDFYYYEFDRWFKADTFGLYDYLRRPGLKRVLFGRNTTSAGYHSLKLKAQEDPDFLPKSALVAGERPIISTLMHYRCRCGETFSSPVPDGHRCAWTRSLVASAILGEKRG